MSSTQTAHEPEEVALLTGPRAASVLAGAPSSGSAEEWTVAGDGIDNDVMEAVRLCFASPYGFLR